MHRGMLFDYTQEDDPLLPTRIVIARVPLCSLALARSLTCLFIAVHKIFFILLCGIALCL